MPTAFGAGALALVVWNLVIGARTSALPAAGGPARVLSALAAFLVLPALAIALLAPTAAGTRIFGPLAWMWPAVTLLFTAQALWATWRSRASVLVTAPLLCFDIVVAWIATARWLDSVMSGLPTWVLLPGAAVSVFAESALGIVGFLWGAAVLMPALVPLTPARRKLTRIGRGLLAAGCTALLIGVTVGAPRAHDLLRVDETAETTVIEPGARGALAIGISLFGPLSGPPAGTAVRQDLALADSLGVTAVLVTLQSAGTGAGTLDSLARTLELRRDSVVLVVALEFRAAREPQALELDSARAAMVERVVRRLRPHVLVPWLAHSSPTMQSLRSWQSFLERVAEAAGRGDRRTLVAAPSRARTSADSALVDWVLQGTSRVRAIALRAEEAVADPARYLRALAALARWASLVSPVPEVWVAEIPTAPAVTGARVQQALVRRTLRWASTNAWVRGIVAGAASDITAPTALRTADLRARPALQEVALALRAQRDAASVTAPPVADSTGAAGIVPPPPLSPDSLNSPRPR